MYNDYCQTCEALNLSLNSDKTLLDRLEKAVEDAYKKLHAAGKYEPKDVTNYKDLIDATNDVFTKAVEKGVADNVIPGAMKMALEKDVFLFSGLKTHAQLFEASRLLLDENKNVKPFSKFSKDIESIKANYNQNYLEAEYIFAQTSAQMAAKWNDVTQSGDRYNLQYRTAGDEKVRESHRVLDQITLPSSDAFWSQYYPPNGWRCRCDAVEVLNSKYDKSDSEEAVKRGEKATSLIGKDGKNRLEIFRFNPGKEKVIFPPKHPYSKVMGAVTIKSILKKPVVGKKLVDLNKFITNKVDKKAISAILKEYANVFPENFSNGLEEVKFTKSGGFLMQHSIRVNTKTGERVGKSSITISTNRFNIGGGFTPSEDLINGFNKIKLGEPLSFNEEYAFESLWHEILHAKSKTTYTSLTRYQRQKMETVNQFVARHTYPDFISSFGGKASNQKEILSKGYGYGDWIDEFRDQLKQLNIAESEALNFLEPHLMKNYNNLGDKINELFSGNK